MKYLIAILFALLLAAVAGTMLALLVAPNPAEKAAEDDAQEKWCTNRREEHEDH